MDAGRMRGPGSGRPRCTSRWCWCCAGCATAATRRPKPREIGVSEATGYRYLHEALDVIAAHAPDLHDVLAAAHRSGTAHLCVDGKLIPTDRVAARVDPRINRQAPRSAPAMAGDDETRADAAPGVGEDGQTLTRGSRPGLRTQRCRPSPRRPETMSRTLGDVCSYGFTYPYQR